jgi:transcriptional regulator with XRE-family HTH domain
MPDGASPRQVSVATLISMPPSERRSDRGRRIEAQLRVRLGNELRDVRVGSGLSQTTLARLAGVSQASLSRLERSRAPMAPLASYAIPFAVLGRTLTVHEYPDASPVRDAAHARLVGRLAAILSPVVSLRTEVPLRRSRAVRSGDLRAWDGELVAGTDRCMVEAETVLADTQALDRRIGLKMEDDGVDRVILLVADTRRNRDVLRSAALLRSRFPLDSSLVLAALRAGRLPERSGIAVV